MTLSDQIQYLYPNSRAPVDWVVSDTGSGPFVSYWNPALGAQPTQPALDAVTQGMIDTAKLQAFRAEAEALVDRLNTADLLFRAGLLATLDAHNRLSRQFLDLLGAIATATSLANLKTLVAAISPVEPERTALELKNAVKNKATSGDAD